MYLTGLSAVRGLPVEERTSGETGRSNLPTDKPMGG